MGACCSAPGQAERRAVPEAVPPGEAPAQWKEESAPTADEAAAIASVSRNGFALREMAQWEGNKLVVLAAVANRGQALQHASPDLQGDFQVVFTAVEQDGWALFHSTKALRADKEFMLLAVGHWPLALNCAAPELRQDPDLKRVKEAAGADVPDDLRRTLSSIIETAFAIEVIELTGKKVDVAVTEKNTVRQLKEKVAALTGASPAQFRLVLQGNLLAEDGNSVGSYGVKEGSVVNVVPGGG